MIQYMLINYFQIGRKLDFYEEFEFINFPKQYLTKLIHYLEINFIPVDPPGKLDEISHIKEII